MDWETDLTSSFETLVHRDFPNPDRVGCPGRNSLVDLATCVAGANPPPWSLLISGSARPVSMNSKNSRENNVMKGRTSGVRDAPTLDVSLVAPRK